MSLKEVFKPKIVKISTTFIDADGREKQVFNQQLFIAYSNINIKDPW